MPADDELSLRAYLRDLADPLFRRFARKSVNNATHQGHRSSTRSDREIARELSRRDRRLFGARLEGLGGAVIERLKQELEERAAPPSAPPKEESHSIVVYFVDHATRERLSGMHVLHDGGGDASSRLGVLEEHDMPVAGESTIASAPLPRRLEACWTIEGVSAGSGGGPAVVPAGNSATVLSIVPYRVKTGDTLEKIAESHGFELDELCIFNFGRAWDPDDWALQRELSRLVGCTQRTSTGHLCFDTFDEPGLIYLPVPWEVRLARDLEHTVSVSRVVRRPWDLERSLWLTCEHREKQSRNVCVFREVNGTVRTQIDVFQVVAEARHEDDDPDEALDTIEDVDDVVRLSFLNEGGKRPPDKVLYGESRRRRFELSNDEPDVWVGTATLSHPKAKRLFEKISTSTAVFADDRHDMFERMGEVFEALWEGMTEVEPRRYAPQTDATAEWVRAAPLDVATGEPVAHWARVPGCPTIEVFPPLAWGIAISLPPFKKSEAGYRQGTELAAEQETPKNKSLPDPQAQLDAALGGKPKQIAPQPRLEEEEAQFRRFGREWVKTKTTTTHDDASWAAAAQEKLVEPDPEHPVKIQLNGKELPVNPMALLGKVIKTAKSVYNVLAEIKDKVPKVGWYADVELKLLEGGFSYSWGYREWHDHRVARWRRLSMNMTVLSLELEAGFGIEAGGGEFEVALQAYVKFTLTVSLKADFEQVVLPDVETYGGPSVAPGLVIPISAEGDVEIGAKLVAGSIVKVKFAFEAGVGVELALHFDASRYWGPPEPFFVTAQLSHKGVCLHLEAAVGEDGWIASYDKKWWIVDPQEKWGDALEFPAPPERALPRKKTKREVNDAKNWFYMRLKELYTAGTNVSVDNWNMPAIVDHAAHRVFYSYHDPPLDHDALDGIAQMLDGFVRWKGEEAAAITHEAYDEIVYNGVLDAWVEQADEMGNAAAFLSRLRGHFYEGFNIHVHGVTIPAAAAYIASYVFEHDSCRRDWAALEALAAAIANDIRDRGRKIPWQELKEYCRSDLQTRLDRMVDSVKVFSKQVGRRRRRE